MIADELWLATSAQTLSQTRLSNVCLANDQIVLRFLPSGLTTTNVHKMTTTKLRHKILVPYLRVRANCAVVSSMQRLPGMPLMSKIK